MKEEYEKYWDMPRRIKSGLELDICPSYSWGNVIIQTVGFSILIFIGTGAIGALLKKTGTSIQFEDSYMAWIVFIAFLMAIRFKSIALELIFQLGLCPLGEALAFSILFFAFFPDYAPIFWVIVWPILFLFRVYSLIKSIKEYNEVAEYYQSDILSKKEIISLFKKGRSLYNICDLAKKRVNINEEGKEVVQEENKSSFPASLPPLEEPEPEIPEEIEIEDISDNIPMDVPSSSKIPQDIPTFEPEEPEPTPEPDELKTKRDFELKDF